MDFFYTGVVILYPYLRDARAHLQLSVLPQGLRDGPALGPAHNEANGRLQGLLHVPGGRLAAAVAYCQTLLLNC